jgi:leader peptidase (prepilin peptidase)/N-methyltransferase
MQQAVYHSYLLILGLCFGSFSNVLIYRLPRKESINTPPSHCPACGHRLSVLDLIPVISWIFLKGKCRYCGVRISIRYPAVEAACAVLFLAMSLFVPGSLSVIPLCVLAFVLLNVSVIDADTQEIPDGLLITGSVAGVLWVVSAYFFPSLFGLHAPAWPDALLGAVAGALPLFLVDRLVLLILKKDGFGFGDVKLMGMVGLFLGWKLVLISFLFAFITGGCYAAFLLFTGRARRGSYLAFGPFLSIGALAALWWGQPFAELLWKIQI